MTNDATSGLIHDFICHIGFDALAALVFIAAVYGSWRFRFDGEMTKLAQRMSGKYFAAVGAGTVIGSYFLGTANNFLTGINAPARSVLGGLCGAIVAVELWKRRAGVNQSTGYIYALPLALMVAVGRLGCAFSGLGDNTYGIPTNASWGWDFGDHIPRHPVALYESLSMLVAAAALLCLMTWRPDTYRKNAFYLFAGFYGAERFALEFLKPYPLLVWHLNIFHLACLGLIAYAAAFAAKARNPLKGIAQV